MMLMKTVFCQLLCHTRAAILGLCAMSVACFSAQAQPLLLITVIEPPASFINSHGEPSGYATELVQALQKQAHDDSNIHIMPESRALLTAERQPNVMLFGFSRTPERESKYHWIMPLLKKRWVIYARRDSTIKINSLNDLRSLNSIGVVRGDVREEWLQQQGFSNLHSSDSHAQNLARLQSGRLEVIAYEPQGIQYLLKETGLIASDFKEVYQFHSSEVWLLMSRTTPMSEVSRWQMAAEQLKLSGKPKAIAHNWQQRLLNTEKIQSSIDQDLLQF